MFRDEQPTAWFYHHETARSTFNMHGLNPPTYEVPPFKEDPDAESIELPVPDLPTRSFAEVVAARSSCRRFLPEPMALDALSTLLHAAYGILGRSEMDGEFLERPVPSGGGLYPLELYVLVQRIDGLAGGAWHYVPLGHRLERVHEHPLPRLLTAEMFLGQSYLTDCSAIVVITSVVQRSLWKYEDRGYRYILLEAGHVAQNLNLCAAAMDLASLDLGGFFDRDVLGLLRADADTEIALYGIALGHPQPVDRVQARRPAGEDATFRRY
ncbi:MAG TPA: SagB/ThcOx family dehydrogenase [Candidatus Limnocylindrales bacterium]|nr:SagB/ThcOx family dehydrogenase [Candidatus Limnocylindrales bacterium]